MQKSRVLSFAVALIALTTMAVAQNGGMQNNSKKPPLSPPGQASVTFADGNTVTIDYSRPSMRNRKIFGGLVPYDQVWRTGANAATSLKTTTDLNIGGTNVPKGNYTIYTLPGMNKWELIINKQVGQWGTEYNQGQDLARIPMKVSQRPAGLETFTISFDKTGGDAATLKLDWENTTATVDVKEAK